MKVSGLQELDSLAREGLRQALYYRSRNLRLANFWEQLHLEAMHAMRAEAPLLIAPQDSNPIPINKACAEHQQLDNPLEA